MAEPVVLENVNLSNLEKVDANHSCECFRTLIRWCWIAIVQLDAEMYPVL